MSSQDESVLLRHFGDARRQLRGLWLKLYGGGFLIVIAGFAIAWVFVEPAPPRQIVIATGSAHGAYYAFAQQYAQQLAKNGITLEVRETAGSVENYELLQTDPDVHLAIVQGGTAPRDVREEDQLEAIGSLYLEPLWVFYRFEDELTDLRDLKDSTVGIGVDGSGTQSIARLLLAENGMQTDDARQFRPVGGTDAAEQLRNGTLDAAFFVTAPDAEVVHQLLQTDGVKLMSFDRHAAYSRRHPFLTDVTLSRGVIDLAADLPSEDVSLVAPAANMVATPALHDSLVPLLLKAAKITHESGSSLVRPGRFPSTEFVEFPLNESARLYFEWGPPFLQKYLPFWIASAIDRGKVLLLPALTLLLPLFKIAPPLYRWRIRSRIYRWYEILRDIEQDIHRSVETAVLERHGRTLSAMELELDELASVPLPYMEEFYNLRLHVEFVERRVRRALSRRSDDTPEDEERDSGTSA